MKKTNRKKPDERELIAKEFWKFMERCETKGIEKEYSAYIAFCIVGGVTLKQAPDDFHRFVREIISKNVT
jgi:hypothetical protein